MEPMPLQSVKYQTIPVGRDVSDFGRLVDELLALPELAARPDDLGNVQAVMRIDRSDDGYCITFPADVSAKVVKNAVAAHDPSPAAPAPVASPVERLADAIMAADDLASLKENVAALLDQLRA